MKGSMIAAFHKGALSFFGRNSVRPAALPQYKDTQVGTGAAYGTVRLRNNILFRHFHVKYRKTGGGDILSSRFTQYSGSIRAGALH